VSSTAKSYGQILGSNDRVNFAVIGIHSRAYAHLSSLKANQRDVKITHVCDVESDFLRKFASGVEKSFGYPQPLPKTFANSLFPKT
jgi:NADH/NAD ratio-sensing transcriptional regulator Rex